MPVPVVAKDLFEVDLETNLSSVDVTIPPNHDTDQAFSVTYAHSSSLAEDITRIQEAVNPLVLISYPVDSQRWLERFFNDLGREIRVFYQDFARGDEVPDSFDLVNDANKVIFTIDISENNIGYFLIYTDIPSGSTSRMIMTLKDNVTKAIIGKKLIYNLEILRGGWTKIKLGVLHWDETRTLEITLEEFSYGSQPDGIRIYKNVSVEYLIRSYYYQLRENKSQWMSAIMRFNIHAKTKTVGSTPSGVSIDRKRITNAIANALEAHIRQYWENLQTGAKFIELVGSAPNSEFLDSEYEEKEQLDIRIGYLSVTPLQDLRIIKKLNINQINLL